MPPFGTEPRGCALSGTLFFVTNFIDGTVAVVDTHSSQVVERVEVGGNDVSVTQFSLRP
jgi:hypothetical protein